MQPIVSIICLAYNHEKYIRDALDGFVKQQTNFPFEIIIHDDASTDNTASIIREYERQYPHIFKPIYQIENQYSKERGRVTRIVYEAVQGKYIAFCEGDDYWTDPLKLQKQVDFLEINPDFNISFHRAVRITPDGSKLDEFPAFEINENLTIEDLAKNNFIPNLSVLFRNRQLDYSKGKNLPLGDYAMHMLNAAYGKIHYHKEVMAAYRVNVGVFSSTDKYKQRENSVKTLNGLIENYGFSGKTLENLNIHRTNLLFYIFKDKFKINRKFELQKIFQGQEEYKHLSFFKRIKYIFKALLMN